MDVWNTFFNIEIKPDSLITYAWFHEKNQPIISYRFKKIKDLKITDFNKKCGSIVIYLIWQKLYLRISDSFNNPTVKVGNAISNEQEVYSIEDIVFKIKDNICFKDLNKLVHPALHKAYKEKMLSEQKDK